MKPISAIKYVISRKYRKKLKEKKQEIDEIWEEIAGDLSFMVASKNEDEELFCYPYINVPIGDRVLAVLAPASGARETIDSLKPIFRKNLNLGILAGSQEILGAMIWWKGEKGKYINPIQLDSIWVKASMLPQLHDKTVDVLETWFDDIKLRYLGK